MALTQVTSAGLKDGEIVNADLHSAAAIAVSKLSGVMPLAGGTLTGNVIHNDSVKALFGTGSDLEIYHDGSNNYLKASSGSLFIRGSDLILEDSGGNDYITCSDGGTGGTVTLKHLGSAKLTTAASGVSVTGTITSTDSANVADGHVQCLLDSGNGRLKLLNASDAATVDIQGSAGNVNIIDNGKFQAGSSNDLQIYHDGSDSYINDAGTGRLKFSTNYLDIKNAAHNETMIQAQENGSVDLYYDNSKKLATHTSGIQLDNTGGTSGTGTVLFGNSGLPYIQGLDSGNHGSNSGIFLYSGSGDSFIKCKHDAAVELYYDNNKKLETNVYGTSLTGNLFLTDSSDHNWGRIKIGAGEDLQIYHDGSHSYLTNSTGILHIRGQGSGIRLQKSDGEPMIYAIPDGAVEIYYDNSKKFETTSTGTDLRGTLHRCEGHFRPYNHNTWDLGTSSDRWANIYTNDLNLSNEGGANDVDGTWGSYTIQEGEEDLFLVNRRNGKKYKFNLTEVS